MEILKTSFGEVKLIDDSKLYAFGTKQRATIKYVEILKHEGYTEFVYVGPVKALGAFALGYACAINNVYCKLFLIGTKMSLGGLKLLSIMRRMGRQKYISIELLKTDLYTANTIGKEYVADRDTCLLVPFGLEDQLYVDILTESLRNDQIVKQINPKIMWIASGSGVLLNILMKIFPDTHFNVVQVGKKITISSDRVTIYISPERFMESAKILPPYDTVSNYDAKIWQFVMTHGKDGDYIWNVGTDK